MTTVSQRDGLTSARRWPSGRRGGPAGSPRPGVPAGEVPRRHREVAERRLPALRDNAEYAALNYLKYPKAVTAERINDPGPSVGKLQPGDALDAVNGVKTPTIEDFTKLLKATKPGDEITIDYRRRTASRAPFASDHPGPQR